MLLGIFYFETNHESHSVDVPENKELNDFIMDRKSPLVIEKINYSEQRKLKHHQISKFNERICAERKKIAVLVSNSTIRIFNSINCRMVAMISRKSKKSLN